MNFKKIKLSHTVELRIFYVLGASYPSTTYRFNFTHFCLCNVIESVLVGISLKAYKLCGMPCPCCSCFP